MTKISVSPSVARTTDSFKTLSVQKRKCKFPHEYQGLEIMENYSQSGCAFECMLRQARRVCGGCTPWNYPHAPGIKFVTC